LPWGRRQTALPTSHARARHGVGPSSRQSLAQICEKKTARVSWTENDRNGRTLGRVSCGGIDANAEQVRRGMAWVFDRDVKDRSL
jgi:endonuclease YncB( thermonuclease family)